MRNLIIKSGVCDVGTNDCAKVEDWRSEVEWFLERWNYDGRGLTRSFMSFDVKIEILVIFANV